MTRAGHVCLDCPAFAPAGQSRCDDCRLAKQRTVQRDNDSRRPTARQRGYDRNWERIARRYRAAHPICECPGYERCQHEPGQCEAISYPIDHIVARRHFTDPAAANRDENLQALCVPCHGRKSVQVDGALGRGA